MTDFQAFDRASDLFEQLMELPEDLRIKAAQERAQGDLELLQLLHAMLAGSQAEASVLDAPLVEWTFEELGATTLPEEVGPYRILGPLGEGGMGVVLEAQQSNPTRHVALKLLRGATLDPGARKRFETEAAVLGRLNHPGIAQVYEAGVALVGGVQQPYIALELVRGVPIDRFVNDHRLAVPARVRLLADLCAAVEHAHQKGIVHRDLKPGNVLVTPEGHIKVLDFGIARMTDPEWMTMTRPTQAGQIIGTLPYMSPEQVSSDSRAIDLRTDVYALGVIAYELLAGKRPLDTGGRSLPDAARMIQEEEPTSLGNLDRRLRGDLEIIVGRALAKEKERRYESAGTMGEDLLRQLQHEPIVARAPSSLYQLRKFTRRHRWLMASASSIVVLSLAFGLFMGAQAKRYAKQRDLAERKSALSQEVSGFLVELFRVADPENERSNQLRARQVLDVGARRMQALFHEDPALRSELLQVMGRTYTALGLVDEAEPLLLEALSLRQNNDLGVEAIAEVQNTRAQLLLARGEFGVGEALTREQLLAIEGVTLERPELAFDLQWTLATYLLESDKDTEVLALAEQMILEQTQAAGPDSVLVARAISLRGSAKEELGSYQDAERDLLDARDRFGRMYSTDHPQYLQNQRLLADLCLHTGRLDESATIMTEVLNIDRLMFGDNHPNVDADLFQLASVLANKGDLDQALERFREVLERDQRNLGDHPFIGVDMTEVANLLSRIGRYDEAWELFQEGLAEQRKHYRDDHSEIQVTLNNIANHWLKVGDPARALEYHEQVLRIREATLPPEAPMLLSSRNAIAVCYTELKRFKDAEPIFRAVLEARQRTLGDHPDVAGSQYTLAHNLAKQERYDEAMALLEEAQAGFARFYPADSLEVARVAGLRGRLLMGQKRETEAEPLLRLALEARIQRLDPGHVQILRSREVLADCLAAQGQIELAEALFVEGLQAAKDDPTNLSDYEDVWRRYTEFCSRTGREPIADPRG